MPFLTWSGMTAELVLSCDGGTEVVFTCGATRAGRGKADSLQVGHSLIRRVKWGPKEPIILTLQSTWLVTSVKEEQSANFESWVTKARMVFPSTKSSCLLLPEQVRELTASQRGSLRTSLGLDDKLKSIGTADAIWEDLVQVDPFAVWPVKHSGSGRNFLCWSWERNAV